MIATTESSRNFRIIKQQDLGRMISRMEKAFPYATAQSEPHQGRTPLIPATIKTDEELQRYFAKLGVYGDGARADFYLILSSNPNLAAYHPDDGILDSPFGLIERRREELKTSQPIAQQNHVGNNDKNGKKSYGESPYSYNRKSPYSAGYFKSAAKRLYNGIDKKVRETFGKIRSVYQSSSGVLKKRPYDGKVYSKDKLFSLNDYKTTKNQRLYSIPHPVLDLEERVA